VRRGPESLLLNIALMFQLAFGMYWQGAQAAPMPATPAAPSAEHCAGHPTSLAPPTHLDRAASGGRADASHSPKKHDCCRTPGCQCQGTFTAMSSDAPLSGGITVAARVLPPVRAPAAHWRSDESLRPPIA
jgi:hypothetical protein